MVLACPAHADIAEPTASVTVPDSTIALIDPDTGVSTGGDSADVRLAVGDIIQFRSRLFPVPGDAATGLQAYATFYIPANTEVTGVRILDEDGQTTAPRQPGLAQDGCAPCAGFNSVPSSTGDRNLADGSIAQVHGDTGVFYSTDSRVARNPGASAISTANGLMIAPALSGSVTELLGLEAGGPFYAHNVWDQIQVQAFGESAAASENLGVQNTPYSYGSPVAGPGTHYPFEATLVSSTVRFDDVTGPWNRVRYPGSQTGVGSSVSGAGPITRMSVDASGAGADLSPASPAPNGTRAVRMALGEVGALQRREVEVSLRVLATPLDPVQSANLICAESFTTGAAGASADHNPWAFSIPAPACAPLNLEHDLTADEQTMLTGETMTLKLEGRNLSLATRSNSVLRFAYDPATGSPGTPSQPPSSTGACPAPLNGLSCLTWNLGALYPSATWDISVPFTASPSPNQADRFRAVFTSNADPNGQSALALVQRRAAAELDASLAPANASTAAGATEPMAGTVSNTGNGTASLDDLVIQLPIAWRVQGNVLVGGTPRPCTGLSTNTVTCTVATTFAPGDSRTLSFGVLVPAGASNGLYPISLRVTGTQSVTGSFETNLPALAHVAVGTPRSAVPSMVCPQSGAPSFAGTTSEADGTTIRAYFDGVQRDSATASAGAYTMNSWSATFGSLHPGVEIRVTAQAPGELESTRADPCVVEAPPGPPRIRIVKEVVPASDQGLFNLRIDGVTAGTGAAVGDQGTTGAVDVSAGEHTISETAAPNPAGTDLTDYVAAFSGDCNAAGTVTALADEAQVCTITNKRRASLAVTKRFNGAAPAGDRAFTFELRHGSSPTAGGATLETQVASATNLGTVSFATKLAPDTTTFALCEQVAAGLTTTLGPAPYNPAGASAVRCTDFVPAPAEALVFEVDGSAIPVTGGDPPPSDPPPSDTPAPDPFSPVLTPPTPAAPDVTPPVVTLTVKARRLAAFLRKGLAAKATVNEAAGLRFKLLLHRKTARRLSIPALLASAGRRVTESGTVTTTLRPGRRARRALARRRSVRLIARVTATDTARNAGAARRRLIVRR